jgi:ribosomal protein S27AE
MNVLAKIQTWWWWKARRTRQEPVRRPRAACPGCGKVLAQTKDGRPWAHRCAGDER